MEKNAVSRILGELAGEASLCWDPRPEGEFDSSQASKFVDEAVDKVLLQDVELTQAVAEKVIALENEISRLKKFLDWLFGEVFDGSPDGGDIQDQAEEMGILVKVKLPQEEIDADPEKYESFLEYETDELLYPYWNEVAQRKAGQP
jgi:hypothetical protein